MFQTSVGGPATFTEEFLSLRKALTKAGCAKSREAMKGKKRLRLKKLSQIRSTRGTTTQKQSTR